MNARERARQAEQRAASFVEFFRLAAPYIHAHHGRTFVVMFGGEAALDADFDHLIHDLALMHSLGIRLVIVHGSRPQIERRLKERNIKSRFALGYRVTDRATLGCVRDAVGSMRVRIEGLFSMGVVSSPMANAELRVASGNFVMAKPVGVRGGVDFMFSGEVRRIDAVGISRRLDEGDIVLLSPIGYSKAGEAFNLSSHDVAASAAVALKADKLIGLVESRGIVDKRKRILTELTPQRAEEMANAKHLAPDAQRHLAAAARACRGGVRRAHLVDRTVDGVLLSELFTREGSGTLITSESYEDMRAARIEDIAGLLTLLRPLEEAGILIRRSRERLELEIERFTVVERDGMIIGCAALEAFAEEKIGELYCVAVHPGYQSTGRGDALLEYMEDRAKERGLTRLFVLTTQTMHWFVERGFAPASVRALPERRRAVYDKTRRSKVFVKEL